MTNTSLEIDNKNPTVGYFDPDKAFLSLPIVRLTLGAILSVMALVAVIIVINENFIVQLDSVGFNNAAGYFKVPIALFTLSIPALALLAANHRSEQTKKQMRLTLEQIDRTDRQIHLVDGQNAFANYYKHLEEFDKRFKEFKFGGCSISSTRKLHAKIFPEAPDGLLRTSQAAVRDLDTYADYFIRTCEGFIGADWKLAAQRISQTQAQMTRSFFVSQESGSGIQIPEGSGRGGPQFYFPDKSYGGFMIFHISAFAVIDEAFHFDVSYKTSDLVKTVLHIPLIAIPQEPIQPYLGGFDIREVLKSADLSNRPDWLG